MQGAGGPVSAAPEGASPAQPPQSSATAPQLPAAGSTATAAAPAAAAVMPAGVIAQEAVDNGASARPAAASTAHSPAADDPALEALLQSPVAEPMDVDLAAPALAAGGEALGAPGDIQQPDSEAAAAALA